MKKLCLTMLAASAMLFSAQNVVAQESAPEQIAVEENLQEVTDWMQIEIQELPAEVQQAVERDFEGAVITEAHVKENEGESIFKLKITTAEGEDMELYADAQGNWIDEEEDQK
jgi:uncharacterized membrane protein YkoI